jgi:hypothetical protein
LIPFFKNITVSAKQGRSETPRAEIEPDRPDQSKSIM